MESREKKKKVVGQAKNKKQVGGRGITELVGLSSDSDNGGGGTSKVICLKVINNWGND